MKGMVILELDLMAELKEAISEEEEKELGLDKELPLDYKILDDKSANFFLKKLLELKQEIDEVNNTCDSEIESVTQKVNAFRKTRIDSLEKTVGYFENLLENFAKSKIDGQKTKSMKLLYGTLRFKKTPDNINYDDKTMIEDPRFSKFVKISKSFSKADFKKAGVIKDGKYYLNDEEVPEVEVIPGQINFSVKFN